MNNKYYILRHGEALLNTKKVACCWPEKFYCPLTLKGGKQVRAVAQKLKGKKIDLIFSSDLLRTCQTAEIVGRELKIKPKYAKKLREHNVGIFNGKPLIELERFFGSQKRKFRTKPPKGENHNEIKKRMYNLLRGIDKKYSGKNILIISHQVPLTLLEAAVKGLSNQKILKKYPKEKKIKTGELREL